MTRLKWSPYQFLCFLFVCLFLFYFLFFIFFFQSDVCVHATIVKTVSSVVGVTLVVTCDVFTFISVVVVVVGGVQVCLLCC